jgi:hypothetical protein
MSANVYAPHQDYFNTLCTIVIQQNLLDSKFKGPKKSFLNYEEPLQLIFFFKLGNNLLKKLVLLILV